MKIGEKLRLARLEMGVSQRQLCGDVITRNMLSQIENGSARPSMDTLIYLAGQLNRPVSYFLEEDTALSGNGLCMEKARQAYESSDHVRTDLMGGLYNNMALTCAALKRFDEARAYYAKAMDMMKQTEYGELEQAITCLNLANLIEAEQGLEDGEHEIFDLLDQAYDLLKTEGIPRDGYYAFVLEKCAPTFGYYGYFAAAQELKETSEKIYAGH